MRTPAWMRMALAAALARAGVVSGQTMQAVRPAELPAFEIRMRVVARGDGRMSARDRTQVSLLGGGSAGRMVMAGEGWSAPLVFNRSLALDIAKAFPNSELGPTWPLVVRCRMSPSRTNVCVEAAVRWLPKGSGREAAPPPLGDASPPVSEGTPDVVLRWDLLDDQFIFLVGQSADATPLIQKAAEYNRRYWAPFQAAEVPASERPRRFPIVDHFSTVDSDRTTWEEAAQNFARLGLSVFGLGHWPIPAKRAILLAHGFGRTSDGDHWPPGGYFDYHRDVTDEMLREWAWKKREAQMAGGFAPEDLAIFAMADEPAWSYPKNLQIAADKPAVLARFREYLRSQGLTIEDLGLPRWEEVRPIGRSQARDLPSRRLFYWSMRFFAWDSTRYFARATRAMEEAFYPGLPVFVNWATHSGRFYTPGGFGGNPMKDSPDAAQGCHDWLEFGRLRGCTLLWIEDWFGDSRAPQWSFYGSKLNSAARKGKVQFGGYIIPRTCGAREDGVLQRILTIVGSGGKAIRYFTFGPEYNFPGNCWSEKAERLVPKMAEAHRMIAAAEDLLWPGSRPQAAVAFVSPRSSLPWDALDTREAPIRDAGNPQIDTRTVDYMSELYGLYLALQHANVPVDWVEEEDLSPRGLEGCRVVFLTEPDVPEENALGLCEWIRAGGTLVTVSGAATGDRYGQPCRVLSAFSGIEEKPRPRLLVGQTRGLPVVAEGTGRCGEFRAFGVRGHLTPSDYTVEATFSDGSPAVVRQGRGQGHIWHFAWMPGMSYLNSFVESRDGLPVGFSASVREWITEPLRAAGVEPPVRVSAPMIETPVLLSDQGAAITLLNWSGEKQDRLDVSARLPFAVARARAVKAGVLAFTPGTEGVSFSLPLGAADIVMLWPK